MTPEGWRTDRLGNFLDGIDAGWSPQCESRPADNDEWGVLKVSAVTSGVYRPTENKALPSFQAPRPELEVHDGDLLLARANGVLELVGRTAIVRHARPRLMLSDKILRIRPRNAAADAGFLHALLSSSSARDGLKTVTGGSHMRNISQGALRDLVVCCPPLGEQRKIAAILSSVDDAIEATQAVIDQLQVVKKAMMAELLTRGLPGRHTRFKKTEIGEVPAEWEIVRLSEVAQVQTGIAKGRTVEHGIELPYLRVANVQDGHVDLSDIKTIVIEERFMERYLLKPGDVLFTEGGDADKLGRGCVWRGQIDVCLHQNHVFAVRTETQRLLPEFLAHWAASPKGKAYFLECAKQTTNLASINSTQLKAFPVPLPAIEEQTELMAAMGALESRLDAERECSRRMQELKSALLSSLLSGEIRVTPDADEASP